MWFVNGRRNVESDGLLLAERALDLRAYYKIRDYMRFDPRPLVIPDSVRKSHWICFGGTRTGKTRILMADIRRAIKQDWNVIVIDPKMEQTASALFPTMVEAAIEAGRLKEFVYVDVMDSERSVKFNPYGVYVKRQEVVEHVLAAISHKEGAAEFFRHQAKSCVTFAVDAYDYLCRKEGKKPIFTISKLAEICSYDWIARHTEILESEAEINPEVRDLAVRGRKLSKLKREKFEEIHADLSNVFTTLGTGVVGDIIDTERGNEIFDRLWEGRGLIMYFYTGSLIVREGAAMISRVFLSALTSLVGKILRFKEQGGTLSRPLLLVVDECQMAVYPGVENLLDKCGGAGVWLLFATQTIANLEAVLGRDLTHVFLDNIGIQLFLNCGNAEETGRYVAARCGTVSTMEVWKRTSELGDGSTVRDRERQVLDAGAVGRLETRKFICFLRKDNEPTNVYVGFVRYVPDPKIKITGLAGFERN